MILFYIPIYLLLFPSTIVNCICINCYSKQQKRYENNILYNVFLFLLSIPAILLICINLLIEYIFINLFGWLYCICTCGWKRYCDNQKILAPYSNGPGLLCYWSDIIVAWSGMIHRQGIFEFHHKFIMMFFLNPWIKYWVVANQWCDTLEERFITQIGQPMDDMNLEDIEPIFQKAISWSVYDKNEVDMIDDLFFCPHYPFPPEGRRMAIGMQLAGITTTIVHTTHFSSPGTPIHSLDKSMILPLYRVMLWHNNPFHIFTGYVEAGLSNGFPSQPTKINSGAHPMWIISGHNKCSSSRGSKFSTGWVDIFFDEFIPHFQRYIRRNIRGIEIADEFYKKDPKMGFEDEEKVL